ncbi:MAG: hypothetical protein IJN82_01470 [Clostridia bacterium]|nr:hypothetical protein [Clostridia bacterium]MBQ7089764.1 hypothetical protein [Clostridia bacterium]
MKISNQDLIQYVQGALGTEEQNGYVMLRRYPEAQARQYLDVIHSEDYYKKTFATAGMRLAVRTDASAFSVRYRGRQASSRKVCLFDLYVNGALMENTGNEDAETDFEGLLSFNLPAGEKEIVLYLPNLYGALLSDLELADATFAEPLRRARKLLCFGDSITQGYTTRYPSLSYANRMADLLDAEVVNKGIGGEVFNPALLAVDDGGRPDIVTVAYGTNDWSRLNRNDWSQAAKEEYEYNHTEFIRKLSEKYAGSKIFLFTPIWRGNADESFYAHGEKLRAFAEQFGNVTVIDGLSLIAHEPGFFMPDVLHPNDLGHVTYGDAAAKEIKKHLQF